MRAVIMRRFGPPGVLEPAAVPSPVPGAGEVAVDAKFAGVTFVETQIRAGRPPRPEMLPALPAIVGNGVFAMHMKPFIDSSHHGLVASARMPRFAPRTAPAVHPL